MWRDNDEGFMNGFADLDAVTRSAESEWAADSAVRAEFGSKETYLAFRRAEAKGLSRTVGRGATAFVIASVQTYVPGQGDAEWDGDSKLRAEFGGNKDDYMALRRAESEGRVRTLTPGAAHTQRPQAALRLPPSGPSIQAVQGECSLAERQAQVRQENVGRQFAGLPVLPVPQE